MGQRYFYVAPPPHDRNTSRHMLNSITNLMHAVALTTYTILIGRALALGEEHFTVWIFVTFFIVMIVKYLGMIVHLPVVDLHDRRHHTFWIAISIAVIFMNAFTLLAIQAHAGIVIAGTAITGGLCGYYMHTLFRPDRGNFAFVALAMVIEYGLCAALTTGPVRFAWVCLIASNALWVALKQVKALSERKLHNDIYHLLLIGSSYLLYDSITSGLWKAIWP